MSYSGIIAEKYIIGADVRETFQHGNDFGPGCGRLDVDIKHEFEILTRNRSALELQKIQIQRGKFTEDFVKRPGSVAGGKDQRDPAGSGINDRVPGNTDETGMIVVAVGNTVLQDLQAVNFGAFR